MNAGVSLGWAAGVGAPKPAGGVAVVDEKMPPVFGAWEESPKGLAWLKADGSGCCVCLGSDGWDIGRESPATAAAGLVAKSPNTVR